MDRQLGLRIVVAVALVGCSPRSAGAVGPVRSACVAPVRGARVTPRAQGRTLHVSPKGSDRNPCTRQAPCREIARAVALVRPGDVILVADGEYRHFAVEELRGTADRPVVIFATGAAARVRAPRCENQERSCRDNILVHKSSHVVIDGLRTEGAARAGLAVIYGSHVTIRNGTFGNNRTWGVFTGFSDDLRIENNEAFGSREEHGIYVSNSSDRPVIRGNRLHHNAGCGVQINADYNTKDEDGAYTGRLDGITTGALIESNVISDNGRDGGAAINLDGVQDSIIRNNVLYDNLATGIVAYGDPDGVEDGNGDGDGRQGPKGLQIYHNTVVMSPKSSRNAMMVAHSVGPNLVRNNILLHQNDEQAGIELVTERDVKFIDSDHNVLERLMIMEKPVPLASWQGRGRDRHSLAAGLSQVFAPDWSLRLRADSPVRDRGAVVAGVGVDCSGKSRVVGSAPDPGALELQGSGPAGRPGARPAVAPGVRAARPDGR
jgi:parallel beta-helix repeat protein